MAAVSVAFDGSLVSEAESESDGGTWDDWGKTTSPTAETDFVFQNSGSISNKVSGGTGGIDFDDDAPIDYTTPRVTIAKVQVSTTGAIDLTVAEGVSYQIGSSGSDYYNYYIVGLYAGAYKVKGGWLILAIDPNEVAYRDAVTGTPSLSAIDYYGWFATISGTVKADNVIHDRLDYITNGTGLTLTGGDGADADGTFQDFVDADQGTSTARFGLVTTGEAEIIVLGVLTIGTATATVFTDSNFVVVYPDARVAEGFFGMDVDLTSSTTAASFTAGVFKSLGKASTKKFFDTALQVTGGATDTVTLLSHGYSTGDYVLYSAEGGTAIGGLTDATNYFVRAVDTDTIALYAVGSTVGRQNSFTDTSRISLTADTAPGANHSFIRSPDTRADYTVTASGGTADWTSCSIDGVRQMTLTGGCSLSGGFVLNAGQITPTAATFDGVSFSTATTTEGEALFPSLHSISGISNCTFTAADEGHAFELTSQGSTDSDNNTYTGFWNPQISGSNNGWNFHTITGIASNVITTNANHGFTTGDAVYYNNEGGSDSIGLTNGNKYYVNVASTTTVTMHLTRAAAVAGSSTITLSDGSTGETHSLYSGKATLYNNSGGSVTVNVLNNGDSPSFRNGTGASTSVINTVTLTVTCLDEDGAAIQGMRVRIELLSGGSLVSQGTTNGAGVYQDTTYNYTGDTNVVIKARLLGYVPFRAQGVIENTGISVPASIQTDTSANIP